MRRTLLTALTGLAAIAILFAQRNLNPGNPAHAPFEVLSVFPRETVPGQYQQVYQNELRSLAEQGWELVGVTPFIYRNEERNNGEMRGPRPVVTQTYPAYFFKRQRLSRY